MVQGRAFSAALSRGLIEASVPRAILRRHALFSAALSRGLIEASAARIGDVGEIVFSAALSRGLIEAGCASRAPGADGPRFSAALSRGLIEAPFEGGQHHVEACFPRL